MTCGVACATRPVRAPPEVWWGQGSWIALGLQDVRKLSQEPGAAHLLSANRKESPGASESYIGRLALWVCLGLVWFFLLLLTAGH